MRELLDLIEDFRVDVGDPELPGGGDDSDSLWSTAEIVRFIDDAQKKLCERVHLIPDSTTYALSVTADDPWVEISDEINKVRSGRLSTSKATVLPKRLVEIERTDGEDDYGVSTFAGDWEDRAGTPRYLVLDLEFGKGRLVPIPTQSETLTLKVFRRPETLEDEGGTLEIPDRFRPGLLHYAKFRAYSKPDEDAKDPKAAGEAYSEWSMFLNEAAAEVERSTGSARTVAYGGLA